MKFIFSTHFLFIFLKYFLLPSQSIRTTPQPVEISLASDQSNLTTSDLENHFHRFGYLSIPEGDSRSSNVTHDQFQSAILRYQQKLGLSVTGKLDIETLSQISTPRCGLPDSSLHGNDHNIIIAAKRRYVYFPGKPRWARKMPTKLTYSFAPNHATANHLTALEVRQTFRRSFSRWSAVIPVSFVEAGDYAYADVRIGFFDGDHGDSEAFDGSLGILAHSFSPENGRLHLDAAEKWAVDGFRREESAAAIDLESVVTHEIGHVLGLGHSSAKEAVMYPSLKPRETKLVLQKDDIEGVQALYGSNPKFLASSLLESDFSSSVSGNNRALCFGSNERSLFLAGLLIGVSFFLKL